MDALRRPFNVNEIVEEPDNEVETQLTRITKAVGDRRPQDFDEVNHPKHYTTHPSGVECITIIEWMSFNLGNAMKYIWRANEKGATIQDLQKARWYLDREIARLQKLGAR